MNRYLFAVLFAVLLALGVYQSRLRPAAMAGRIPTGEAEWIWAADSSAGDGWVSFFVYRDFDVGERVPERVELAVQADAGYWAFVNRHPVGSGGFRERAPVDSYRVESFLEPGANRLLIQVRSRRGVGGVLARLDLGEQGSLVTDRRWRSFRRYESAVLEAGFVPEDVGRVRAWGRPPIGAWHVASERAEVPVVANQLVRNQTALVTRFRALGERDWDKRVPSPESRTSLGRWVIFDLGRLVEGYINVAFVEREAAQGLIYTGLERPTGPDTAEPSTWFASPPGRGSWTDPQPRSFRFVTVLALTEIAGLRVFETEPGWVASRGAGEVRPRRAFSFAPPESTSTIEDEFWSELERVTGLTGREAFKSVPGG